MPVPSKLNGKNGRPQQNETNQRLGKAITYLSNVDAAITRVNFLEELQKIKRDLLEEIERNPRNIDFDPELYGQATALMRKALHRIVGSEGDSRAPKKVQFVEEDGAQEHILGDNPHAAISGGKNVRDQHSSNLSSASKLSVHGAASATSSSEWVHGLIEFDRLSNLVFEAIYNQAFIEVMVNYFVYNQNAEHWPKSSTAGKALLESLTQGSKENDDEESGLFWPGNNPTERAPFSKWRARLIANFTKQLHESDTPRQKKGLSIPPPMLTTQQTMVLNVHIQKLQGIADILLGKLESMGAVEGFIQHPDASRFVRTTYEHLPAEGRIVIFRRNWRPEAKDKTALSSFKGILKRHCFDHFSKANAKDALDCAVRRQQWLYSDFSGQLYDEISNDGNTQEDPSRLQDGYNISDLSADSRYCPETAEAWFADMPPYFPWGETPYARVLISQQIDKDLEEGEKALAARRSAASKQSPTPATSTASESLLAKGIRYLSRQKNQPADRSVAETANQPHNHPPTGARRPKRLGSLNDDVERSGDRKKRKRT